MLDNLDLTTLIIVFITLVISITLHEAMHAFSSYWLGDDTAKREGRISLNPLRHIDPLLTIALPMVTLLLFQIPLLAAKPVPFNPHRIKFDEFGAALTAAAGPFTNFVLAAASASILTLFQGSLGLDLIRILSIFMIINIGIFVFNMIPIPPLDGSRILYAFSPEPFQRVLASLEQFGFFIIFGLVLMVPKFGEILGGLNEAILNFLLGG